MRTAPPKEISDEMWHAISVLRETGRFDADYNLRARLVELAIARGFSEQDFIERGIIEPPRPQNPCALKGARRR